jgi:hypothetical protein
MSFTPGDFATDRRSLRAGRCNFVSDGFSCRPAVTEARCGKRNALSATVLGGGSGVY